MPRVSTTSSIQGVAGALIRDGPRRLENSRVRYARFCRCEGTLALRRARGNQGSIPYPTRHVQGRNRRRNRRASSQITNNTVAVNSTPHAVPLARLASLAVLCGVGVIRTPSQFALRDPGDHQVLTVDEERSDRRYVPSLAHGFRSPLGSHLNASGMSRACRRRLSTSCTTTASLFACVATRVHPHSAPRS